MNSSISNRAYTIPSSFFLYITELRCISLSYSQGRLCKQCEFLAIFYKMLPISKQNPYSSLLKK